MVHDESITEALQKRRTTAETAAAVAHQGRIAAEAVTAAADMAEEAARTTAAAARAALEAATLVEASAAKTADAAKAAAIATRPDHADLIAAATSADGHEALAHQLYEDAVQRAEDRYDNS
jgi:hypothetical protein